MRWVSNLAVLLVSVVLGYTLAIVVSSPVGIDPSHTPEPGPGTSWTDDDPTPPDTGPTTTTTPATPTVETYLIWATGGLTPELIAGLSETFEDFSVVKGDVVELARGENRVIPLDAVAVDPRAHRPFDPTGSLAELRQGTVILSETSAGIRGAKVGDVLMLAGFPFEIVGVTPDETVGAAEVIFLSTDPDLPIGTDRYILTATEIPRAEFENIVRSFYDGPAPLRIRANGETPWLRHGDAVLPQALIKLALGEFSYANRDGSEFTQDKDFLDGNIIEADIPILGRVSCHRVVAEMLNGAMTELVNEGLAYLVDPSGFRGCWSPRYIRSSTGVPAGISRHAWGAAVDINAPANPVGSSGSQDPRLVKVMQDWGFTWGGDWLVPDPMHFEYGVNPG